MQNEATVKLTGTDGLTERYPRVRSDGVDVKSLIWMITSTRRRENVMRTGETKGQRI